MNLTTRVSALESDMTEVKGDVKQILALLEGKAAARKAPAPAKVTPAKPATTAKQDEFVAWLRETAPQRAARKSSNAEMAAWLRSKGLTPNGAVWEACKAGERSVAKLRKLA